jgi:hypothetical protein
VAGKVICSAFASSFLDTNQKTMSKTVLLIGRNPTVLTNLASALTEEGFSVKTTNRVEPASEDFNAAEFDLIAFGRGVDETTNTFLKANFTAQNPKIIFVDGLAPVIPLLVRQIKLALSGSLLQERILARFSCQQTDPLLLQVTTASACRLIIDLYQLDAVHNTQQKTLVSAFVSAGNHTFSIGLEPEHDSTINFLVAEANNSDLRVLPLP